MSRQDPLGQLAGPFPGFVHAWTASGSLTLRWTPPPREAARGITRAHAVVVLRPLGPEDEAALWGGAFDHDAIRFPVDPATGQATVFAPADRALTVGLAFRDDRGQVLAPPRVEALDPIHAHAHAHIDRPPTGASGQPDVAHAAAPGADAQTGAQRTGETAGETAAQAGGGLGPGHPTPPGEAPGPLELVFVEPPDGGRPPDLAALARRVAAHLSPTAAPNPAPEAPATTPGPGHGGAFGARGRWYPVHLQWTAPPEATLRLVRRARFVDAPTVASWADAPPEDAEEMPTGADGLIDASIPPGEVRFYVVLAGPAPWRPVALAPASPPFARPLRPHLVGDVPGEVERAVQARLSSLEGQPTSATDLAVHAELLAALARRCHPEPRAALLARIRALRDGTFF